jgi:PBP1b-binding outer membrane lipoprotein LpoB
MMKVALLLTVLGSTIFFAGCAKDEKAKTESTTEVTTPSGDKAEVQQDTTVTTSTEQ